MGLSVKIKVMLEHKYCSVCGSPLEKRIPSKDTRERLCCPRCQYICYLNPKPTVKGLVVKDGNVLFVRRAEEPGLGGWDFPGGYLEWDEHPETGLVREIEEETGLITQIDRLLGVYHKVWKWDHMDSSIVNITYVCNYVSGTPLVGMPHEIDDVVWAPLDKPPGWVAFGHYKDVLAQNPLTGS